MYNAALVIRFMVFATFVPELFMIDKLPLKFLILTNYPGNR